MSFYVRVFSMSYDHPSRIDICEKLIESNFEFSTFPGKLDEDFGESDYKHLMFQYDENQEPIRLERNVKKRDKIFEEEQEEFQEVLEELPDLEEKRKTLKIITDMVQIYAIDVADDIREEGWDFLDCILDYISEVTDGYIQIDNEGIYDKDGKMLVAME